MVANLFADEEKEEISSSLVSMRSEGEGLTRLKLGAEGIS